MLCLVDSRLYRDTVLGYARYHVISMYNTLFCSVSSFSHPSPQVSLN